MKTVGKAAVKTVAEAMVEMRKSPRHHDSGPEPEKPRLGGPIRIIGRIAVIVRISRTIGIFGRRGNHVDLRRQSRRSLGDPPAPIGLLAGLDDGLLLLSAYRYRDDVAGAGWLVGRRLRDVGRVRCGLGGRRQDIRLGRQAGRVLHDLPATVRLLTRPGICLLRPCSDRYRRVEVAAVELRFVFAPAALRLAPLRPASNLAGAGKLCTPRPPRGSRSSAWFPPPDIWCGVAAFSKD